MIYAYEADTADSAWQAAADWFRAGQAIAQPSRGGLTFELPRVSLVILDPRQRWVFSRRPALNPAAAISEVIWILRGRKDSGFVNFWNPSLSRFCGRGPFYHGAYGPRLRSHFGLDQLERAQQALRASPDSRQIVLQIWDAQADLPGENGSPISEDIPCNVMALLKIRNGRLEWTQIMRSNDFFRGLPYNIVQFTTLQEIFAGWLGVEVGPYSHFSDSLHLYEADARVPEESPPGPEVPNCDTLGLPWAESEAAFRALEYAMEQMTSQDLTESGLRGLAAELRGPRSYRNLLLVAAADAARRHRWRGLTTSLMEQCTNPALRLAWLNWEHRLSSASPRRSTDKGLATASS